jgi:hypothetical protein
MKPLFTLLLLLSVNCTFGQFQSEETHISGKFSYGSTDSSRYNSYGLQIDLFVEDFFSVNYNFDLTYDTDNIRYFHTPLGLIGGPPLIIFGLLSSDSTNAFNFGKGGAVLGLLLLILPDGAALHIPIRDKVDISPYANVLGLDFIRDRNSNEKWIKYSLSLGARITYLHKSGVTISFFGEYRKPARFSWMKGIGISAGFRF